MTELKIINDKLSKACSLLDDTAKDIAELNLVYKTAWLKSIGEALAEIILIQHKIYFEAPELKPDYLNEESMDKGANRQFGDLLLGLQGILAKNKPLEAIALLEDFITKKPPEYLIEITKNEIVKIKDNFKV